MLTIIVSFKFQKDVFWLPLLRNCENSLIEFLKLFKKQFFFHSVMSDKKHIKKHKTQFSVCRLLIDHSLIIFCFCGHCLRQIVKGRKQRANRQKIFFSVSIFCATISYECLLLIFKIKIAVKGTYNS